MALQEYFRTSICLDAEQAQNGNLSLPGLKKLLAAVCKNLNRWSSSWEDTWIFLQVFINQTFTLAVRFPKSCRLWRSSTERWTSSSLRVLDCSQNKLVSVLILGFVPNTNLTLLSFCITLSFQISSNSSQSISDRLEQLTKLLYSIEDKVWDKPCFSFWHI